MSNELEHRALKSEALLGFVLLAIGKEVIILKELVESNPLSNKQVKIETLPDRLVVSLADVVQ